MHSSEANPSQVPIQPSPGLPFSLISCQHSPCTLCSQVHSPLDASFHTSTHLISLLLTILATFFSFLWPQWVPLKTPVYVIWSPTLGRPHWHLQIGFPQPFDISIVLYRYLYHKTYYIIYLLIIYFPQLSVYSMRICSCLNDAYVLSFCQNIKHRVTLAD